ncbi:hypothetical protein QWJ34_26795 [Saccharibacillus sp. CPCC 101409]|uniref:hypothetical protein n=1 Tax=Saccharibacillus sp. CPCC 101409 TaxID=3058041 RepID=UPI00267212E0|nr:hypothetical protein [Saccharibacillus sp. CPCC 101409]MDO3413386.1 hypothetical protein [Saccharibacillus sp. CPCC 101409]
MELLTSHHGTVLRESFKQCMIAELYDRKLLKQTTKGKEFLEKFDDALQEIRDFIPYGINKKQAQKIFRDIQEVQAVPRCLMNTARINKAMNVFNDKNSLWKQKKKARKDIENYLVGVNMYKAKKSGLLSSFPGITDLYIIDAPYDLKTGLEIDKAAYSSLFL